eukprot:c17976_g1_i1 orf=210-2135(-)
MQSGIELSKSYELTVALQEKIAQFLTQHEAIWRAHVVEFFQERLWETLDRSWLEDLQEASVEDLLLLPSGRVQGAWSSSLKDFISTAQSLSLLREPRNELGEIFPGMCKAKIGSVVSQGMNFKKQHEVEVLSPLVNRLAEEVNSTDVIDVGAGQGYLAQVLAFEYQLPVVAIDASAHHAGVINERAKRIQKHYTKHPQKSQAGGISQGALAFQDHLHLTGPQTMILHISSRDRETDLFQILLNLDPGVLANQKLANNLTMDRNMPTEISPSIENAGSNGSNCGIENQKPSDGREYQCSTLVLAGLHACGDLSATMIRTFLECKEVKAAVIVGCCYNLLSEEYDSDPATGVACGFPLSKAVKALGLRLGKRGRDLACQSAERWKAIGTEAALENFEQHAFRAAFQLALSKIYPEIAKLSPSVGRLGKGRRRRQSRRLLYTVLDSPMYSRNSREGETLLSNCGACSSGLSAQESCKCSHLAFNKSLCPMISDTNVGCYKSCEDSDEGIKLRTRETTSWISSSEQKNEKQFGFQDYACTALARLGLKHISVHELAQIWKEVEPHVALIGPFWSLRAVLAPVIETYILLDRLLYLQEHIHHRLESTAEYANISAIMLIPLFSPSISPRNMAIISIKSHVDQQTTT